MCNWYIEKPTQDRLDLEDKNSLYHSNERKCIYCNSKFSYGRRNKISCGLCKIFVKCRVCDKYFQIKLEERSGKSRKELSDLIIQKRNILIYCSQYCRQEQYAIMGSISSKNKLKNLGKIGICSSCSKESIITNINGNCSKCTSELLSKAGKISGLNNKKLIGSKGICCKCNKECIYNNIVKLCDNCFAEHNLNNFLNVQNGIIPNSYAFGFNELFNKEIFIGINYKNEELDISKGIYNLIYLKNVCGAIGLIGTSKQDGKTYCLTAGKSNNLYYEIRKFMRILFQPEKQIPYGEINPKTGLIDKDYGRWYDITHNYSNFKILLLGKNLDDQTALLTEYKWAIENNALFKCNIDKKKLEGSHGYWLP